MVCPSCHQDVSPQPVGFTWWGGFIGSKVIHHVECPSCRKRFNGRTGQSNDTNIAIYVVVVSLLILGLFYVMYSSMR